MSDRYLRLTDRPIDQYYVRDAVAEWQISERRVYQPQLIFSGINDN